MFRIATAQALLTKKIAGLFQFIGISNTNYGNRVNESKTAGSRNRCEIIDEFCPVANEQKLLMSNLNLFS